MSRIRLIVITFLFFCRIYAQEVVSPLSSNTILLNESEKHKKSNLFLRLMSVNDTLSLPFFDDFSTTLIYPDTNKWIDKTVYINRDFPIAPPSIGVATFDGLSSTGCPYDTISTNGNLSAFADSLTSKHIHLNYQASDSVYLSFYYQPKGRGDKPELDDSLLLYFKNATNNSWKKVWGTPGLPVNQQGDSLFKRVMLKVDTAYLKDGFQFKFKNKATRLGNVDHWHIDYVYLNSQRNKLDTTISDVTFVYTPTSFLKRYQAMPWKQYLPTEMVDSLSNFIRNHFNVFTNTQYNCKVYDQSQVLLSTIASGSGNIEPFVQYGYTFCTIPSTGCRTLLRPPLNGFQFPSLTGNTIFNVEHILFASPDLNHFNDTIRKQQIFKNYFAYDDGTAELAYGLNVAGSKLAYKFSNNTPDTLRSVDMYFNWINNMLASPPVNSITQRQFRITIWGDNNGTPGSIIYQDSIVTPAYEFEYHNDWGNLSNKFYKYNLTTPLPLGAGTYYVGWVQYTNDLLNIGLDRNTNANLTKLYYNTSGNWVQSAIQGSVMIRPVFGTAGETAGEQEIIVKSTTNWIVFPNPANDVIQIKIDDKFSPSAISITDQIGRVIYSSAYQNNIIISTADFSDGIYFVRLLTTDGNQSVKKLIIAR